MREVLLTLQVGVISLYPDRVYLCEYRNSILIGFEFLSTSPAAGSSSN